MTTPRANRASYDLSDLLPRFDGLEPTALTEVAKEIRKKNREIANRQGIGRYLHARSSDTLDDTQTGELLGLARQGPWKWESEFNNATYSDSSFGHCVAFLELQLVEDTPYSQYARHLERMSELLRQLLSNEHLLGKWPLPSPAIRMVGDEGKVEWRVKPLRESPADRLVSDDEWQILALLFEMDAITSWSTLPEKVEIDWLDNNEVATLSKRMGAAYSSIDITKTPAKLKHELVKKNAHHWAELFWRIRFPWLVLSYMLYAAPWGGKPPVSKDPKSDR